LYQSRGWTPARLGAFTAAQPAGEIVHEGGRRVLHRCEVDVARRLAARAPDLKPGVASIHGLIDGGRRIERFAV